MDIDNKFNRKPGLDKFLDEHDLKVLFGADASKPTEVISPERFRPKEEKKPEPITEEMAEETDSGFEQKIKTGFLKLLQISWKFAVIFVVVFILSFVLINLPAVEKKFSFFVKQGTNNSSTNNSVVQVAPTPNFDPTAQATLSIPKIGITAPIIWNVPEDNFNAQLLNGVAHFAGTALPGQNGNVFITGHSSYYSWVKSDYKDVFALLDKLAVGDKVYIQYQKATYTYTVKGSKVVSPKDMEVLSSGVTPTLTLMTCVPIGTNLNRLIVTADQTNVVN